MWVILGHLAVLSKKSGQRVLGLKFKTLSWHARPLATRPRPSHTYLVYLVLFRGLCLTVVVVHHCIPHWHLYSLVPLGLVWSWRSYIWQCSSVLEVSLALSLSYVYTRTGQSGGQADWRGGKEVNVLTRDKALSKPRAFSGGVKEEVSHKFSPNLKRNALMALRTTPECLLFYSINCPTRLNLIYVRKTTISARASLLSRVQSVTERHSFHQMPLAQDCSPHPLAPPTLPYMGVETGQSGDPPTAQS